MPLPECLQHDVVTFEQRCRASARAISLPDDVLLATVFETHLLYLDAHDRMFTPHACTSYWESWVSLCLARSIVPGASCLDLGAHQAWYTLLMALATGPTGHVCGVEPNPRLAGLCRWSLDVNGVHAYSTIVEAAVSETAGKPATLVMAPHRAGNATLVREPTAVDHVMPVTTTTVDVLTQDWPRLDLIKCDIEGSEEAMWAGMTQTLRRFPKLTLVLEVNTARYEDPERFYRSLAAHFPLRAIDLQVRPRQVTIDELMTVHPTEDWMLWLRRSGTL